MIKRDKNISNSNTEVRVRFAPSPTGDLHVGGVRTALFNYLYARHTGGKFLLRIEDTDKKRSTSQAVQVILDGLSWLELEPDEEPIYQSTRIDRHIEAANKLLDSGCAYRCFCSPERLSALRDEKPDGEKLYMYDRHCLNLSNDEIEKKLSDGEKYALRLKIPEGEISFNDGVHGNITVSNREIDDFILLRRDGTPTYMLAVVVDDIDMGITNIIRGDDHISNTPKQILIYRALGQTPPEFAHVPLIMGPDKKRLSKRHGATSITEYHNAGYLLKTMINYLGLLGWSPGDDRNIINHEELIELFDIPGIQSKSAVFDETKVRWLNGQYLGNSEYRDVTEELNTFARQATESGMLITMPDSKQIEAAWMLLKNRVHFLKDLFDDYRYMFRDPDSYNNKGVKKHFRKPGVTEHLEMLKNDFANVESFELDSIEGIIRNRSEEWEVSAGKLIHPLRLACSGVTGGAGLFEMLEALGKDAVIRRIQKAVNWISNG
ncbi:MAG: glutamate--tRNA ligase [Candidatus Hatepunaea meridiana]|nr:glutamate--tRNA ligase [Candidatus Hatepunaea meridiana]